ncbi:hypothetical protein V2G26_016131 [Clonostachys chloroleuca]|uniref:Peptidase S54 rhomboid domain-containing protein n=1 Tax=Clonostachys chloroleuca TaxID=1926264 RepID=A0AA35Q903_9HYPO|nr:unnamed protein product [Clonostachys chloroleuca]
MSFTNTPVTRLILLGIVSASTLASLLDIKHYFYILVDTHVWRYRQLWRFLIYQLCYTNSTEVLFGVITLYQLRIVERMWGSRKYASFLVISYLLTSIVPPSLTVVLRPLTAGWFNYIPAGPTPIIFAVLAQYHAMIPHLYKYRIATSQAPPTDETFSGVTFSDKSLKYAIAVHLALLQWPGSLLGAIVGWVVGYSWREGLLPSSFVRWRMPGWMLGLRSQRRRSEFEGLRRMLEDEGSASSTGAATGAAQGQSANQPERRRTMGQQIMDQFRDVL